MSKMRKKARLSAEQDALLERYLQAYRSNSAIVATGNELTAPARAANVPSGPK
jgi:hypothetical protein